MLEWIIKNYQILLAPVTGLIIWFGKDRLTFDKDLKDRDNTIESSQSEIVSKNLELYQRMLDDIEKRYEERIFKSDKEKEELEVVIIDLKIIISDLENDLIDSRNINAQLELKTKKFINEIINLKSRLEKN